MTNMTDLDVHIEQLSPMRVAWVRAFGASPEQDAWQKLSSWAKPAGLLEDPVAHPVFGFNNPPAQAGVEGYGYEYWIAVDPTIQAPAKIGLKHFAGGRYAVTSCSLSDPAGVPARWKALLRWVHSSEYSWRRDTHELERVHNPLASPQDIRLDLMLPLED
jgi:DNA gyrase inhibitor GyrI